MALSADAGGTIKQHGAVTLAPLSAEGSVELRGAPIKRYAPYYGRGLNLTVEGGMMNAAAQYRYQADPAHDVRMLSDGSVSITGLRLKRTGKTEDFLKIPQLSITGTHVDLVKHEIAVGEAASRNGLLLMERARDGTIDVLQPAVSSQGTHAPAERTPSDRRTPGAQDA